MNHQSVLLCLISLIEFDLRGFPRKDYLFSMITTSFYLNSPLRRLTASLLLYQGFYLELEHKLNGFTSKELLFPPWDVISSTDSKTFPSGDDFTF